MSQAFEPWTLSMAARIGAVFDAGDREALFQRGEILRLGRAVHAHAIAPEPAALRQLQGARQRAVVGEQQQPLGIEVEPSDRNDARHVLGQMREHGLAPALVLVRGDEALGLVIAPEARALPLGDGLAVDPDVVVVGDIGRRAGEHRPGDADAARQNPALGLAARAHARARDELRDALSHRRR